MPLALTITVSSLLNMKRSFGLKSAIVLVKKMDDKAFTVTYDDEPYRLKVCSPGLMSKLAANMHL